ncbi:SpoIIE family protein phosphatase [Streptomyces sp. R11]|uniref:protein-serine/threonine phosphatase n=1 Tax=Streptomyces sp. R11 TaxID=3238625 RepID=A0AB39NGG6_9ACTN
MNTWDEAGGAALHNPLDITRAATMIIDGRGVVSGWSSAAQELLGYPPDEVIGKHANALLARTHVTHAQPLRCGPEPRLRSEAFDVRHRDGRMLRMAATMCPLTHHAGLESATLVIAAELEALQGWDTHQAMLADLVTRSPIQLAIYDNSLHLTWANMAAGLELGAPLSHFADQRVDEIYPEGEVISKGHPATLEEAMQQVLRTGVPIVDLRYRARMPSDPEHVYVWSCSYYRLTGARGEPLGVCEEAVDITERYRAQQRLALLVRAGAQLGRSLDMTRIGHELAEVCIPDFADAVAVDVLQTVIEGEEPDAASPLVHLQPTATGEPSGNTAVSGPTAVQSIPDSAAARCLSTSLPVIDQEGSGVSRVHLPLRARGATMGLLTLTREAHQQPFDAEETMLATELARLTAVCIDNARMYTGQRRAALTLQRSLTNTPLPTVPGLELAGRYLPASSHMVGGDWFDVIGLPGGRTGLVIGDVMGHGVHAAAVMGQLRTAVRTLARLGIAPAQLLRSLDAVMADAGEDEMATCVYAVYDPAAHDCVIARAGHPPPLAVGARGAITFLDGACGMPLGVGGQDFQTEHVLLPPDGVLVLYTDGLIEARDRQIDQGMHQLAQSLHERSVPLAQLCDRIIGRLLPHGAEDDVAVLLARPLHPSPGHP